MKKTKNEYSDNTRLELEGMIRHVTSLDIKPSSPDFVSAQFNGRMKIATILNELDYELDDQSKLTKKDVKFFKSVAFELLEALGEEAVLSYKKRLLSNPLLEHPVIRTKLQVIRTGSNFDTYMTFLMFLDWLYSLGATLEQNKIEFPTDFKQLMYQSIFSTVTSVFFSEGLSAISAGFISMGLHFPIDRHEVNFKFLVSQIGAIGDLKTVITFITSIPGYLKKVQSLTTFSGNTLSVVDTKEATPNLKL